MKSRTAKRRGPVNKTAVICTICGQVCAGNVGLGQHMRHKHSYKKGQPRIATTALLPTPHPATPEMSHVVQSLGDVLGRVGQHIERAVDELRAVQRLLGTK